MIGVRVLDAMPAAERERLRDRGIAELAEATAAVAPVVDAIRERGDAAIVEFLDRVDRVQLPPSRFVVEDAAIEAARAAVPPDLAAAMARTLANLERFHRAQLPVAWSLETEPGVVVGERFPPVGAAGLYVPFGKAVYPSTALMLTVPARVAGVERIVLASGVDPATGEIPPPVIAAAALGGATEIWRISGTAAVGAFAFGTETLRPVDVVAGPGGLYVEAAKRLVQGRVGIDLDAGPSEILVLALDAADPDLVAADLLAEAEHGPDSCALAVTTDDVLAHAIAAAVAVRAALLPAERRRYVSAQVAAGLTAVIVARDAAAAIGFAEEFAPEHLVIHAADPERVAGQIRCAGTVCIGASTPSPAGSYVAGTNHVLPTGRAARYAGGLSATHFLRRQSYERITPAGLASLRPAIAAYAAAEGLPAHLAAVDARLP